MYEMTKSRHDKMGQNSLPQPEPNFFELNKKNGLMRELTSFFTSQPIPT